MILYKSTLNHYLYPLPNVKPHGNRAAVLILERLPGKRNEYSRKSQSIDGVYPWTCAFVEAHMLDSDRAVEVGNGIIHYQ